MSTKKGTVNLNPFGCFGPLLAGTAFVGLILWAQGYGVQDAVKYGAGAAVGLVCVLPAAVCALGLGIILVAAMLEFERR